jgi:hypothetical protein
MTPAPPPVLITLHVQDSGEFGNAHCPHCGAAGRYITTYLTEDGEEYSAMAGCLNRAKKPHSQLARLTSEAFTRERDSKSKGKKLARWWQDIIDGVQAMRSGQIDIDTLRKGVAEIEIERQDWLRRNGYTRGRR